MPSMGSFSRGVKPYEKIRVSGTKMLTESRRFPSLPPIMYLPSTEKKALAVGLTLAATWATARADDTITAAFDNSAAHPLPGNADNLRIFTADYTAATLPAEGTYIAGSAELSLDLGSVAPNSMFSGSTSISYAAGTSAYVGLFGTVGNNGILIASNSQTGSTVASYLNTGNNFATVYNAIVNGTPDAINTLVGDQETGAGTNTIILSNFDPATAGTIGNANLFLYVDTAGTVADSGFTYGYPTFTGTGTPAGAPEPGSITLTGLGVVAFGVFSLLRRRRRKARA